MRWIALAAVTGTLLAVGAAPAFTADSGGVAVTVTAQAPTAPCLTVTPRNVDFGTLPFSTNAVAGTSSGSADITVTNCGTVGQNLLGATTNATGPSGSWTPVDFHETLTLDPCTAVDRFYLSISEIIGFPLYMIGTPRPVPLSDLDPTPAVFPPGDTAFRLTIYMPCTGSNGAGEQKSLTTTFTAVLP